MSKPTIASQQALLAVEAAGLDVNRPLAEQVGASAPDDDVHAQVAELSGRVDRLIAAKGSSDELEPPGPIEPAEPASPQAQELGAARDLAARLRAAQSPWMSVDSGARNRG